MSQQQRPGDEAPRPGATPGADANAFIEEIVRRDAEVAERTPPRPRGQFRSRILLVILLPVLVELTGWKAAQLVHARQLVASKDEATARFTLYLVSQKIDDYRIRNDTLPASLATARAEEEDVTYRRSGNDYTLTIELDGHTFEYNSGDDWTPFLSGWERNRRKR